MLLTLGFKLLSCKRDLLKGTEEHMNWQVIRTIALAMAMLAPISATAQAPAPSPTTPTAQLLQPAQLDQLVAPIALYPDPLLAQVLMASTYPLDVVQAHRWADANKNLNSDQLKAAADKQPWDDSVKALIPTPDVLEMMSTKLDWTQKLGDAVVAQQSDVMDAIQRLRARAQGNNKLSSTKEQTVSTKQVENKQVITIEPTDPNTIYVPYYDPNVVYGTWPYPDYPPYYNPAPYYIGAGIIGTGIAFGAGYALGRWASGGNYWGGNVNWNNNNININRPTNGGPGNNWKPRVEHRQGAGNRGGRQQGLNFRGSNGQQVLNPGQGRGNAGNNNRGGNRPNAGAGNKRPSAGTRPSGGGQRHKASTRPNRGGNAHHARPGGGHRGGPARGAGGGGHRAAGGMHRGGGGGMRGGGGGRGGGGRRSDIRLKHDVVLLGHLDDGVGFYRFSYDGSDKAYVGVIAQEVQQVMPQAVVQGSDGYLRVHYRELGVPFESYGRWLRSGAHVPHGNALPVN